MSALEALHTRGAHFVLCRVDKRPLWREWQKKQPGFEAVKRHAAAGGLVGLVPASLGCVVVDVDEGGSAGVEALRGVLGEPVVTVGTRGGGFHLWYPAPAGEIGNRKWGLPGAAGDIRGSRGFVVCWDPSALVDGLAANFAAAAAPSLHALSKLTVNGHGPEAVRVAKPGARNDTLNREAFVAAARGGLDGDAFRDAAAAAGLPPGEVEATLGSAARAGAEKAPEVVPSPSSPMAVARALAAEVFTSADGALTLRQHRGGFYRWSGRHWPAIPGLDVRRIAYVWLEHGQYHHPEKDELQAFNPTRRKIDDVIDALLAVVMLDSAAEAPCWIDGTATLAAEEIVSVANGLLHVPTRAVLPHAPGFFNHHSLPFPYEPECGPPVRWLKFLDELWGDDQPSIDTLQEAFGYLLGGGTSQQKMFFLDGPKRAGKGTIGRVLTGLVGAHNVAAPTLASLSTNFGLSPLIDKPLALISDARLSGRSDSSVVVERLLSISGEDSLTVDRKYKEPWTGRLPTRLVLLTNELPRLTDASGALVIPVHRLRPDTVVLWAGEHPADGRAAVRVAGDLQLGAGRARPAQQTRPLRQPRIGKQRDPTAGGPLLATLSVPARRLHHGQRTPRRSRQAVGGLESMVRKRGPGPRQQSPLRARPARRSADDQENTALRRRQTNQLLRRDRPTVAVAGIHTGSSP